MTLKNGEVFDRTDLDVPRANRRGWIHRDYIAHCMRWSFVKRFIIGRDAWLTRSKDRSKNFRWNDARVLDVGCGKDLMLYATLNSNKLVPKSYVGVDINKLEPLEEFKGSRTQPILLGETDFCSVKTLPTLPNIAVCFEVLEHVPYEYAKQMLKHMYNLTDSRAYAIVSTPVYSEKYGMAANHINEMTREQMIHIINESGWSIKSNYGTFAGRPDIKEHLKPEHKQLWDELAKYHCSEVMSNFLAPLYPEHSRNNLWLLVKNNEKGAQIAFNL